VLKRIEQGWMRAGLAYVLGAEGPPGGGGSSAGSGRVEGPGRT
jgi:hypothetical protein